MRRAWGIVLAAGALALGVWLLVVLVTGGTPPRDSAGQPTETCVYGAWSAWSGDSATCTALMEDCRSAAVRSRTALNAACEPATQTETDSSLLLPCSQNPEADTACGPVQCIGSANVEAACYCGDVVSVYCCPVHSGRPYCIGGEITDCASLCYDNEQTCEPPCTEQA